MQEIDIVPNLTFLPRTTCIVLLAVRKKSFSYYLLIFCPYGYIKSMFFTH